MSRPALRTITWTQSLFLGWVLLTALFWALNLGATEGYSPGLRLVFWAVHVAIPLVLCQTAQIAVMMITRMSDWLAVLLSGILGGAAFIPIAAALDLVFPDADGLEPVSSMDSLGAEAMSTFLPVVIAWVALNAPRLLTVKSTDAPDERPTGAAFLSKVPPELGTDIVALSAELHYLRVYTRQGDTLILYAFGRAVEQLDESLGQQIHRSHWVAYAAIEEIERKGEGGRIRVTGGTWLPVSRRYRKSLFETVQGRHPS